MDDLISREYMKSLGATCIASRSKDGTLFPIVAIDELPPADLTHQTPSNTLGALDCVDRKAAIDAIEQMQLPIMRSDLLHEQFIFQGLSEALAAIKELPSVQPERLTDDDFETIRIHLNAFKEKLCNQQRWEEAEEYQRIIDRFMAFASAQPRKGKWIEASEDWRNQITWWQCSECGTPSSIKSNFCPNCGYRMEEGDSE